VSRRGVLQALQRLAVVERDEARSRSVVAAKQLFDIRESCSVATDRVEATQRLVVDSLEPGKPMDPVRHLASTSFLMGEWHELEQLHREVRRSEALDERAQRELASRQARVKVLERVDQRRLDERRREETWAVQREDDRVGAELGAHLGRTGNES
jgi:hypothetical protein